MKKFILCSLLINIAFYSAYGAEASDEEESSLPAPDQGVNNLPDLPDIKTFFDALELANQDPITANAERQRAQELKQYLEERGLPEVSYCFELHCKYCTEIYSLPNPSSEEAIERLNAAFKKHKQRHKQKLYCCPICEINYLQDATALKKHIQGQCGRNLSKAEKESLLRQLETFKTDYTRYELEESLQLKTQQRHSKYTTTQ
ncbi:MAG: hypothetical protein EBU90_18330 [Proteobacteria bacterium]|nr:hypothetical protein [Pseudomonadota bacterium]NBP14338.1 hypothetical protein [bacterium]